MQAYIDTFIENFIKGIPNLFTALAIFIVSLYFAATISKIVGVCWGYAKPHWESLTCFPN